MHPREVSRDFPAASKARQRKSRTGNPTPARQKHRRVEQCLDQHGPHIRRMQVLLYAGQLEAMRRSQREQDFVVRRGSLQLEIELAAKALAQREPPGPVDAAAKWRMDDELHATGFVKETFEDQGVLRRQTAQGRMARGKIFNEFLRGRLGQTNFPAKPVQGAHPGAIAQQQRGNLRSQPGDRLRQLIRASRRFAKPEWNGGRRAMRIGDADGAALDAQDTIGLIDCRVERYPRPCFRRQNPRAHCR